MCRELLVPKYKKQWHNDNIKHIESQKLKNLLQFILGQN
jgi:hypothetical protein